MASTRTYSISNLLSKTGFKGAFRTLSRTLYADLSGRGGANNNNVVDDGVDADASSASSASTSPSLRLHYEVGGRGDHPVLLLPGALGSTQTDFEPQLRLMKDDQHLGLVAWDPRGYGLSRPPNRDFDLDFFDRDADDAVALMKHLDLTPFSMLGWSDGGITAMHIAAKYPDHVRKMVIWGSNAYVSDADMQMYESIRDIDKWSDRMKKPMIELYGEEYFRRCWEDWVDCFKKVYCQRDGNICRELLSDIQCPTLIIHGDKDPMVGDEHPRFLLNNIKNSKLINVTEGKHNLHLKFAQEFNKRAKYFLLNG